MVPRSKANQGSRSTPEPGDAVFVVDLERGLGVRALGSIQRRLSVEKGPMPARVKAATRTWYVTPVVRLFSRTDIFVAFNTI